MRFWIRLRKIGIMGGLFVLIQSCSYYPPSYSHLVNHPNPSGAGVQFHMPVYNGEKERLNDSNDYFPQPLYLYTTLSKGPFHIVPVWGAQGWSFAGGIHNQSIALSIYSGSSFEPIKWQPGLNVTYKASKNISYKLCDIESFITGPLYRLCQSSWCHDWHWIRALF